MPSSPCGTIVKLALMGPPGVLAVKTTWLFVVAPTGAGRKTRVALIEVWVATGWMQLNSVTPEGRVRVDPRKPVPLMVTRYVESAGPSVGVMLVNVGSGAVMLNAGGVSVLSPLGVTKITLTGPSVAPACIAKLAIIVVPSLLVMTVSISGPALSVAPNRVVPVMITPVMVLCNDAPPLSPDGGTMLVITGGALTVTVKSALTLVPLVVTEMGQTPNAAPMAKGTLICVALTTLTTPTVISGQAVTVVPGTKLDPVMVTVGVVSAAAWLGANDRFVGIPAEICQTGP